MRDCFEPSQHKQNLDVRNRLTAVGDVSHAGYKRPRQLEKEDIVVLILSAVLVVATFLLATRIL
jgi:hypothetical protein